MSVTFDQLATELNSETQIIVDAARQMITSSDEKVLTVEQPLTEGAEPVACLTDHAAEVIRARILAGSARST